MIINQYFIINVIVISPIKLKRLKSPCKFFNLFAIVLNEAFAMHII